MAKFNEFSVVAVIGVISVLLVSLNVVPCSANPVDSEVVVAAASNTNTGVDTDLQQQQQSEQRDDDDYAVVGGEATEDKNNNNGAVSNGENDSNCDCNDEEALYHKVIRQLIDSDVIKDKQEFLKEFPIKKICGSDGNLYRTECELQCTKQKQSESSDLTKVNRSKCKKFGKSRLLKGKNNSEKSSQPAKLHHKHIARMQRPENEPETLVCICPRNYFPVCASNGVTYGNKCAFECAKENIDEDLTIVTLGEKCNKGDVTAL